MNYEPSFCWRYGSQIDDSTAIFCQHYGALRHQGRTDTQPFALDPFFPPVSNVDRDRTAIIQPGPDAPAGSQFFSGQEAAPFMGQSVSFAHGPGPDPRLDQVPGQARLHQQGAPRLFVPPVSPVRPAFDNMSDVLADTGLEQAYTEVVYPIAPPNQKHSHRGLLIALLIPITRGVFIVSRLFYGVSSDPSVRIRGAQGVFPNMDDSSLYEEGFVQLNQFCLTMPTHLVPLFLIDLTPARDSQTSKYGYMNTKGELVLDCKYDEARGFNCSGMAIVALFTAPKEGGTKDYDRPQWRYSYIDRTGDLVLDLGKNVGSMFFDDGYAVVETPKGKQGVINTRGEWVIGLQSEISFAVEEALESAEEQMHLSDPAYSLRVWQKEIVAKEEGDAGSTSKAQTGIDQTTVPEAQFSFAAMPWFSHVSEGGEMDNYYTDMMTLPDGSFSVHYTDRERGKAPPRRAIAIVCGQFGEGKTLGQNHFQLTMPTTTIFDTNEVQPGAQFEELDPEFTDYFLKEGLVLDLWIAPFKVDEAPEVIREAVASSGRVDANGNATANYCYIPDRNMLMSDLNTTPVALDSHMSPDFERGTPVDPVDLVNKITGFGYVGSVAPDGQPSEVNSWLGFRDRGYLRMSFDLGSDHVSYLGHVSEARQLNENVYLFKVEWMRSNQPSGGSPGLTLSAEYCFIDYDATPDEIPADIRNKFTRAYSIPAIVDTQTHGYWLAIQDMG